MERSTAHKPHLSKWQKGIRLIGAFLDPRAYIHGIRLLNYYNYSHVQPRRRMTIGADPSISPRAVFSNAERIKIGDRLRLGSGCHLWAGHGSGTITIGDDVLFGPDVLVTAATYRFNGGTPVTRQPMDEADIVIGDDVWIASRVIILPGVTIGNYAIIGAGAVVKSDIPAGAIAVGAPARVIGFRNCDW